MVTACELFASMPNRDVISWGTLLAGYSQTGCFTDALQLFDRMVATGLKPEAVAIVCVLSCCGQLWELERGKAIHEYLVRNRVRLNVYLSTGLVDMYVKCGCIGLAREMFESSRYRNLFTWNVIIVGLGMHGHGELTLEYFGRMVGTGVRLDGVSFVVVLWVVTRLVVGLGMHGHGELTFEYFGRMVGTGVRLDGVSFVVVLWVVTWLVDTARKLFGEMDGVERELKHYG